MKIRKNEMKMTKTSEIKTGENQKKPKEIK